MPSHTPGAPWTYFIPLIALAVVVARNARGRRLRVEWLWVGPVVLLAMTGLLLAAQEPPSAAALVLYAVGLGLGALGGWWRGRLTHISVDPESHRLTSRTSPIGMALILVIFALRYAARSFGGETAGLLHVNAMQIADALLVLAVGIVCAQRLEMALRATRLLNAARADLRR